MAPGTIHTTRPSQLYMSSEKANEFIVVEFTLHVLTLGSSVFLKPLLSSAWMCRKKIIMIRIIDPLDNVLYGDFEAPR